MPTYTYVCENCNNRFELYLTMDQNEMPINEKCPTCSNIGDIKQIIDAPILGDAYSISSSKKIPDDWRMFIQTMKKNNPNMNSNIV